jgi:phosphoglucomutase
MMSNEEVNRARARCEVWQVSARFDENTRREAAGIAGSEEELLSCFGSELSFGTGGIRGILGVGTNRMNLYTVARAAWGLAEYIKKTDGASVAIAYDSRHGSRSFAEVTAGVLAFHGIHAWMYDRLMPTPMLSFAVREIKCTAGVMVTASHNPAQYNGYKVYGSDGCQITEQGAAVMTALIERTEYTALKWLSAEEAAAQGFLHIIPQAVYDAFISRTLARRMVMPSAANPLRLVYTPLHGAGLEPVRDVLARMPGIHMKTVNEQCAPDGDFPTCPYPNPEMKEALEPGIAVAAEYGADILIATDPDCDRVGVVTRQKDGGYRILTGNEVGLLLMDFILDHSARQDGKKNIVIKSIVTSDLAFAIAKVHDSVVAEVLTGFKYIGEMIGRMESAGEAETFVFGFEESCGYLAGTHVRDKDAVMACMLIAEMAQACAADGQTLDDAINALYDTYGYIGTRLLNFTIDDAFPMEAMGILMEKLRASPPEQLDNTPVTVIKDYLGGIDGLPASDILSYENGTGGKVMLRPSGTEPKVKVYISAKGKQEHGVQLNLERMAAQAEEWLGIIQ